MTPKQKYRYRKGSTSEWNACKRCKQYWAPKLYGLPGHCHFLEAPVKGDMTCTQFEEDFTKLPDIVKQMMRKVRG